MKVVFSQNSNETWPVGQSTFYESLVSCFSKLLIRDIGSLRCNDMQHCRVARKRTLLILAESLYPFHSKSHGLFSSKVFGVLLSQQELGSDGIPHLVAKCLQFVETYGMCNILY